MERLKRIVLYCIVSIHLYIASCSAHHSETLPVRETQREESSLERTKRGTWTFVHLINLAYNCIYLYKKCADAIQVNTLTINYKLQKSSWQSKDQLIAF